MEMSRQRLRPALAKVRPAPARAAAAPATSAIPNPARCRSCASSRKSRSTDSTAAVLCQVPVDVASFLLNEKRTEIAKIELKQRINVPCWCPTRRWKRPTAKLERLKHDDPRLDNIQAGYKLADEVEDPTKGHTPLARATNKQTPGHQGVLPDAPAPWQHPALHRPLGQRRHFGAATRRQPQQQVVSSVARTPCSVVHPSADTGTDSPSPPRNRPTVVAATATATDPANGAKAAVKTATARWATVPRAGVVMAAVVADGGGRNRNGEGRPAREAVLPTPNRKQQIRASQPPSSPSSEQQRPERGPRSERGSSQTW